MKSTGIIVEYNPFHNGHKYHLKEARRITESDVVIAVMSGDFLQRGEPAIINKWKRCETAIKAGVDLVIELPAVYATQSAEIFALGAVSILEQLKVNSIVFGSENSSADELTKLYEGMAKNRDEITSVLKAKLSEGVSYPNAINYATKKVLKQGLEYPNDILGFEYINAIKKIESKIVPISIRRFKTGYFSKEIRDDIASATYIRELIKNGKLETIKRLIPFESKKELIQSKPIFLEHFFELIKYKILSTPEEIKNIQDVENGFENRLYKIIKKVNSYDRFINEVKTKRYTISRINRILIHILLGITREKTEEAKAESIEYLKVLGMNKKGADYLSGVKKEIDIPIVTNYKNIKRSNKRVVKNYDFNENASRIYNIVSNDESKLEVVRFL